MITVGGVDTYYDYNDRQWKHRRLGGGPVRPKPICPRPPEHKTKPEKAGSTPVDQPDR